MGYKLLPLGGAVHRLLDNAFIPMDNSNSDYLEYLKWLSNGNTPIPADE
jgi:hypothetical protein